MNTIFWVSVGILVVVAALGYFAMRQRKKQEMVSWNPSREGYDPASNAELNYPRNATGGIGSARGDG